MKTICWFLILLLAFPFLATARGPHESKAGATGIYGVCSKCNDGENAISLQLELREDFTFRYVNRTDPSHPVDVTGTWKSDGNTVHLGNFSQPGSIPSRWKLDDNGTCIRARNKFEFIRICDCDACGTVK